MNANNAYIRTCYLNMVSEAYRLKAPIEYLQEFLLYTNKDYSMQWFHELIAKKCQALFDGTLGKNRLMVFISPQTGKSEIISRCFPAWALGKNPDLKIVAASHGSELATQFSRSVQRIMTSYEYANIFPDSYFNGNPYKPFVKGFISNLDTFEMVGHKGFYKAVGVGGSLTGTPADIAIIDDPVKDRKAAYSATERDNAWDWYNSVLKTRLHNNSKQLFVMTRWHEDDLAGRILKHEEDKWEVITIPAICEEDHDGVLASPRHIGDALWEEWHSKEGLLNVKRDVPSIFAALYQQRPVIEGGNIIKREWFKHISFATFKAKRFREPVHFYLDTAYNKRNAKTDNDPSGILAACCIDKDIYLCHAMRVWKEMPDLLRFLPQYIQTHFGNNESILHVEPKANGISVVQMLRESTSLNVKQTPTPTDSKETRLHVVAPVVECGKVYLVDGDWNEDFLTEVCGFPAQPHDEFVDILGYALNDLQEDELDWEKITTYNLF